MSVQNKRILGYVRLFIHKNKTEAWQKLDRSFTEAWQKLDRSLTEASQKFHRSFTEAWQKLDRSFREFPDHCSLKAIVYRIVFLSKLESFTGAAMQRRFRRGPARFADDLIWIISVHIFYKFTAYLLRRENPILSKPRCRHGSPASKGLRTWPCPIRLYERWEAWTKACKTKWTFATRKKIKNSSAYDIFGSQILSRIQLPP